MLQNKLNVLHSSLYISGVKGYKSTILYLQTWSTSKSISFLFICLTFSRRLWLQFCFGRPALFFLVFSESADQLLHTGHASRRFSFHNNTNHGTFLPSLGEKHMARRPPWKQDQPWNLERMKLLLLLLVLATRQGAFQ